MPGKALKVGGWAGAAALVTALAGAYVQVRPTLADVELAKAGKARLEADMEEIRRHAIDDPVRFEIIGTSRGVVQLSVFETGCVRAASANRLRYLPSPEHEVAALLPALAGVRAAGLVPVQSSCQPTSGGQCALPPGHPTWDRQIQVGADGYGLLYDLIWDHGDVLRARFNSTGSIDYLFFVCCSHVNG